MCPQVDSIGALRCPKVMDCAHGRVPLAWGCVDERFSLLCSGAGRGLLTCPAWWFASQLPTSRELPLPLRVCLKITR